MKGCRCSRIVADRIVQGLSWHQVHTAAEAAAARRPLKAAGVMPEAEGRWCVMADGARWIWNQAQVLFPAAVERLAYDHGSERLHKVAAVPYGVHPERQRAWCEAALARLFAGEGHGVIGGLQRMQPTDAQAAEASRQRIASLQRHQARVAYRFARKGGSPTGSGGIASANTCICHVRLKRSGAWWGGDQCPSKVGAALRQRPWYR